MRNKLEGTMALIAIAAQGQAPARGPQFEVASFKVGFSPSELQAKGLMRPVSSENAGRFETYATLDSLINTAFRLEYYQKPVTGPGWMTTAYFEISAKLPEGATRQQIPEMLRALLVERLKLAAHLTGRQEAAYTLMVGKDGLKLKAADNDAVSRPQWVPKGVSLTRLGRVEGPAYFTRLGGVIFFEAEKVSMKTLARVISEEVGLPVVDKTGIPGLYEVSMPIPGVALGDRRTSQDGSNNAAEPSGIDMVQSAGKLGLKLEKGKALIERLIVDHVERVPTEN